MSPLIEVTNTVGQGSIPDSPCTNSLRKSSVKSSRGDPKFAYVYGPGETDKTGSVKSFKLKREVVAIKMCNTQMSGPVGSASSCQQSAITNLYPCVTSPMRVPPLPQSTDVLLSQAVQALSLGPLSAQPRLRTRRRFSRHHKGNIQHSEVNNRKLVSSCDGVPEPSGGSATKSAPQQCGACGLEFTSLPILTQHLARHVYDGLYAAQWLTQAMGLVLTRHDTLESVPNIQDDHESELLSSCSPD
nr:uncharacterized protein LOC123767655 [Procambarus clarkii]XP_045613465.1 uncharacterized protein LOC123767655 [Procambarus clarkii]XP_045613477.1 uncharacterized protein LOC123767655 [Procambarus clarkii]